MDSDLLARLGLTSFDVSVIRENCASDAADHGRDCSRAVLGSLGAAVYAASGALDALDAEMAPGSDEWADPDCNTNFRDARAKLADMGALLAMVLR